MGLGNCGCGWVCRGLWVAVIGCGFAVERDRLRVIGCAKKNNNNNNKIINENITSKTFGNYLPNKIFILKSIIIFFLLQFSKHPNTSFRKQKTKNSHQTYPYFLLDPQRP